VSGLDNRLTGGSFLLLYFFSLEFFAVLEPLQSGSVCPRGTQATLAASRPQRNGVSVFRFPVPLERERNHLQADGGCQSDPAACDRCCNAIKIACAT